MPIYMISMHTFNVHTLFFASTVDKYGGEEIAEAIAVTFTDELTANEFNTALQKLSKYIVDLLNHLRHADINKSVDRVKAFFKCYKWMLKFEYKGKNRVYTLYSDYTMHLVLSFLFRKVSTCTVFA